MAQMPMRLQGHSTAMPTSGFIVPALPVRTARRARSPLAICSASHTRRTFLRVAAAAAAVKLLGTGAAEAAEAVKPVETLATAKGFLTRSGLKYVDFAVGEGDTPKWGDYVNVHYVTYTVSPDGTELRKMDSTYDRGNNGYLLHHGNGELVLGFEEALHTMRPGGRRRAIVPQQLAYNKTDLGPVPLSDRSRRKFSAALDESGGVVVFDIELRKVWEDPDDRGYYTDLTPSDEEIIEMFQNSAKANSPTSPT